MSNPSPSDNPHRTPDPEDSESNAYDSDNATQSTKMSMAKTVTSEPLVSFTDPQRNWIRIESLPAYERKFWDYQVEVKSRTKTTMKGNKKPKIEKTSEYRKGDKIKWIKANVCDDFMKRWGSDDNIQAGAKLIASSIARQLNNDLNSSIDAAARTNSTAVTERRQRGAILFFNEIEGQRIAIRTRKYMESHLGADRITVYNDMMRAEYDELPLVEKQIYEDLAEAYNRKGQQPPTEAEVFEAQKYITAAVDRLLYPLIGFGHNQYGTCVFQVKIAVRTEDEQTVLKTVYIGGTADASNKQADEKFLRYAKVHLDRLDRKRSKKGTNATNILTPAVPSVNNVLVEDLVSNGYADEPMEEADEDNDGSMSVVSENHPNSDMNDMNVDSRDTTLVSFGMDDILDKETTATAIMATVKAGHFNLRGLGPPGPDAATIPKPQNVNAPAKKAQTTTKKLPAKKTGKKITTVKRSGARGSNLVAARQAKAAGKVEAKRTKKDTGTVPMGEAPMGRSSRNQTRPNYRAMLNGKA